jgi:hypothetical protein
MEQGDMMEIMIPMVDNYWAYFGAFLGLLVLEQQIFNKLLPNGKTRLQKWKADRLDDVIVGIPLTLGFVANMNYVWYWQNMSFTWSNFWTGLACGLISMSLVYAVLDFLPMLWKVGKEKILKIISNK